MSEEERQILFAKFDRDVEKRPRLQRLVLATDQWFAVLLLNTSQDETISSYLGRTGKHKWLCRILRLFESKHCIRSLGE